MLLQLLRNHRCREICFLFMKSVGMIVLANMLFWPILLLFMMISPSILCIVPRVQNGTLYAMDFDEGSSTITYNLFVVFSFSYPDTGYGAPIDLSAVPMYGGQKLGPEASLPSVQVLPNTTMMVPMEVQGKHNVGSGKLARKYADDARRGFFTLQTSITEQGGSTRFRYYYLCTLHFPAPATASGAPNLFNGDECLFQNVDS